MHGISPPMLGSAAEAGIRRSPSHGSWASGLGDRGGGGGGVPELFFPDTTAGHITEVRESFAWNRHHTRPPAVPGCSPWR